MMKLMDKLRLVSVAAVMLAGSCASPLNDGRALSNDGAQNHPITAEPRYQSIHVSFSAPSAWLMPDDAARFDSFVSEYLAHGNGAISVSAPAGRDATAALHYFGERLFAMGVARSRILVSTHDVTGNDASVEIGYIGYVAHSDPCGDWSTSVADTASNQTAPNFGCATQHNLAAQVADPRDFVEPHAMEAADAERRATVFGNYEKGKTTSAEKTEQQSGAVSEVGSH